MAGSASAVVGQVGHGRVPLVGGRFTGVGSVLAADDERRARAGSVRRAASGSSRWSTSRRTTCSPALSSGWRTLVRARPRQAGGGGVVEAGDGDVAAGHLAAGTHGGVAPERQHVAHADDRGRRVADRRAGGRPAAGRSSTPSSPRSTAGDVEPRRRRPPRGTRGSGRRRRPSRSGQPTKASRRWPSAARWRRRRPCRQRRRRRPTSRSPGSTKRRPNAANGTPRSRSHAWRLVADGRVGEHEAVDGPLARAAPGTPIAARRRRAAG